MLNLLMHAGAHPHLHSVDYLVLAAMIAAGTASLVWQIVSRPRSGG